jgi:ribonuclease E
MKKEMLINVLQPEECRIAILEDGVLEELYVERTSHESYVGNIYKGRIVNIEPSIQAAFVDFGVGRNGFLHVSDVEPAYYRHLESHPGAGRDRGRGRDRDSGRGRGRGRDNDRGRGRGGPRRERRRPVSSAELLEADLDALEQELPDVQPGQEELPEFEPMDVPQTEEQITGDWPDSTPEGEESHEPAPAEAEFAEPTSEAEHRRGRGGRRRREESTGTAEPSPDAPPEQEEPRPRFMDSAERRTDEGEPDTKIEGAGSSSVSDEDICFPREPVVSLPPPVPRVETEYHTPPPRDEPEYGAPRSHEPEPAVYETEETFEPEARAEEPHHRHAMEPGEDDRYAEELAEDRFGDLDEGEPRRRERGRDDRNGSRGPRGRRPGGRRMGGRPGMGRPKPLIQDIFKRGQEVLVQVIKEGIGTKGPTLSTYISIAGRYLVLMPGLNRVGVSRKIADDEQRRRLREIFHELKPPRGLGFIIRTAGMDKNKKELQRDLAYLSRLWQVVVRRIQKMKAPAEIYQESDMITRTIRDTFTSDIDTIWVDEPNAFGHAQEFLQIVMPRYANRIKHYDGPEPLFHKYGIEDEIARIQQRHVPLPHGGSIVIDQTEALVAIDVNSGNFRADNNAEETAYQMNLHAAREIARQLRLRDLGGVIVNDFIDMREEKHRRGVEKALRDAIKRDRARTKVLKISQFGLIEMTRQRIRPSLKRSVYQDCPHCLSSGQVKTCESMSIDVMRMVQLAAHRENVHRIQIRVAEDVANYLLNKKRKDISRLEESADIQIQVTGLPGVAPETLEFVCLDNNNSEIKVLPYDEERSRRR